MSTLKASRAAKAASGLDQPGLFDDSESIARQHHPSWPTAHETSRGRLSATVKPARPNRNDGIAPEVYRLGDLMRMFGYADSNSFRDWRRRVEAHGFPAPLPGCSRPLKWDRRLVDAWRSGEGIGATQSRGERSATQNPVNLIALAREKLRRKAASRV